MARLDKNKSIIGAIGNIVFKKIGNTQVLQSKPSSVKQTERTKAAGSEFRQCSLWGQSLRHRLHSFLEGEEGGYMHSRLNGALYAAIQMNGSLPKGQRSPLNSDMSTLAGFEFNTHSPFSDYFSPAIEAELNEERQVVATVPEFDPGTAMQFIKGTAKAELLVYVMATSFEPNSGVFEDYTIMPIPNNYQAVPATNWTSQPVPEEHLVLVCAKLLYYNTTRFTEKHYVNSKECSPAKIVMAG